MYKLGGCFKVFIMVCLLSSCSDVKVKHEYPYTEGRETYKSREEASKREKLFGDLLTFGGKKKTGLSINLYLWQASIDTLTFMGLEKADADLGIIETKWYIDPAVSNERTKINVAILGSALSIDNLRVSMKKETRKGKVWKKTTISKKTIFTLEDVILSRATEFKIKDN